MSYYFWEDKMNLHEILQQADSDLLANMQPGAPYSMESMVVSLRASIEDLAAAYTYNPDGEAQEKARQECFTILSKAILGMKTFGAFSRAAEGVKLGNDSEHVIQALTEERDYQDQVVTADYQARSIDPSDVSPHTYTDELAMMITYLRDNIEGPMRRGDEQKAAEGMRKIGGMAARAIEWAPMQ